MPQNWFEFSRFGLFLHFGLYSAAARHEWVQSYEQLTDENYRQYFDHFDPDRFDAALIVKQAKAAGARYVVLTAKHHDGFCLWDSGLTDFTAPVACGRDLIQEYVEALRDEELRVGLYYSLLDWHHPDFTIDANHPRRDDPEAVRLNEDRDMSKYRAYLHGQVRELLTDYGQIDYLFFDFSYPETQQGWPGKSAKDWDAIELRKLCRELQPNMLINDRLGISGDFVTPEQYQPTAPLTHAGKPLRWEACQTTNGSWGYHRDNFDQKPADLLARMLTDSVSMGGNMLLNVGPDGRGAIAPRDQQVLTELGEWMALHKDAIIGAGPASFTPPSVGAYTQRGNRLYLHLYTWPLGVVHLQGLAGKVSYARFLHDGSWLKTVISDPNQSAQIMTPAGEQAGTVSVYLPVHRPEVLVPVIELTLEN